jgi:cytochrome c55X
MKYKTMRWSLHNKRLAAFAFLTGMIVTAAGVAATAPVDATRQAELSVLLEQDCGSCHGLTRKGGLGSALLPDNIAHFTDEALIEIILDGVPGTPMPPWRRFLNRAEASWIVDRLRQGTSQ